MELLFILVFLFVVCIVVAIIGSILLFSVENRKIQNCIFFVLACWALFISYINAISIPALYMGQQMLAWILGFLSVFSLLIRYAGKSKKRYIVSNILVTISILSSALWLFIFMH